MREEAAMGGSNELSGPDFTQGVAEFELEDGKMLLGHAQGEAVLMVRRGSDVLAVGASCTHYGGPLAEGILEGDTVRCPWHHACFNLRTGEAERAPALNPIACWQVEQRDQRLFVRSKAEARGPTPTATQALSKVVIIGGGAAGQAAAEMLRRQGYLGTLTMLSADPSPPCDRPNLSKDYLAGTAPEEWIPLRPPQFFAEQKIDLVLRSRVTAIDVTKKTVIAGNAAYPFDALLLATGAEPVRLGAPGSDLPHVHYLRTLADSRAIIASLASSKRAVVLGASFIGLEVAAALRARKVDVRVVAPEPRPLERVLGPEMGDFVRRLHEQHGVKFHLGQTAKSIAKDRITLANGAELACDLVVAGIGVRPAIALAEAAGLAIDRGVAVNEYLETSAPGIFAAGDIARWPDPHTGENIRVEHWVVAERQGQIAAKNMLGQKEKCALVPFFWSQHYDVGISYVGHAEKWDRIDVEGSIEARDCTLTYRQGKRALAVVTMGRDRQSLAAEAAMERARAPRGA
jgi:NADPH-dependent 2,4-dienoyl-CoA reductase/sulfur reductase-like enzyme/nitrite reductase/ring-hydroxylating ferredoxin subunit